MHLPAILPAAHIQPVVNNVPYSNQPALEWADLNQWPDAETAFPAAYEQDWDSSLENQETFEDFLAKPTHHHRKLLQVTRTPPFVGTIFMWPSVTPPAGYLSCDGSAVSRSRYPQLFAAIGTTFGSGDGSSTFNLPDFANRIPVGAGRSGGFPLGDAKGSNTHSLKPEEMPSHFHTGDTSTDGNHQHDYGIFNNGAVYAEHLFAGADGNQNFGQYRPEENGQHTHPVTVAKAGSSASHNNMMPFMVIHYIIRAA
jgi:microcystin-dependent protein